MALLSFLGAIQQVTGSCYLIETHDGARVLLECGMHQGRREEESDNRAAFAFDPKSLDAVVLSHAHIDHSGLLPLVALGYRGPVHCTEATAELLELMLLDSAQIQEKDAEWENKWRARIGKPMVQPLYTRVDAERTLGQRASPLRRNLRGCPGRRGDLPQRRTYPRLVHRPDGCTRPWQDAATGLSGDLGNVCSPLMPAPTVLKEADVVLMESTYGDRDHRSHEDTIEELAGILQQATATAATC